MNRLKSGLLALCLLVLCGCSAASSPTPTHRGTLPSPKPSHTLAPRLPRRRNPPLSPRWSPLQLQHRSPPRPPRTSLRSSRPQLRQEAGTTGEAAEAMGAMFKRGINLISSRPPKPGC